MSPKSRLILCQLAFFIAAVIVDTYGWRPKQEYNYKIEGRTVADIPELNSASTGIHYKGILSIQSISYNLLYLKLQNVTYTKIHQSLSNGWWQHEVDSENEFTEFPITDSTVVVKFYQGMVETFEVSSELDDWEINFISGILSHLQIDHMKRNAVCDSSSNTLHGNCETDDSVFRVMEDSVLGKCEVLYDVAHLPEIYAYTHPQWLPNRAVCGSRELKEITKTFNYNNCETNVEHHFGLPASLNCDGSHNSCGDIWKRAFVNRIMGCGNQRDFILLASVSSSRILANLHKNDQSAAGINSFFNLSLVYIKPTLHHFSKPLESVTINSLKYRFLSQVDLESLEANEENVTPITSSYAKSNNSFKSKSVKNKDRKYIKKSRHSRSLKQFDDSSEETENSPWNLPQLDIQHPPYQPFSSLYLSQHAWSIDNSLSKLLNEILNDISNDLESPTEVMEGGTVEKVHTAVQLCRLMKLSDLKQVLYNTYKETNGDKFSSSKMNYFKDILVICGTNPAFKLLKTLVEQGKIKGENAAMALSRVPLHIQTPTKTVIHEFFDLIKSSAVHNDEQLKISATLAFSNILRVACVNDKWKQSRYPLNLIIKTCNIKDVNHYLAFFIHKLKQEMSLKSVYIVALGNTALSGAVQPLKEVIEDENSSTYIRATAIYSLRHLAFRNPKTFCPILLSVFQNRSNPVAIRLAAVSLLMYSSSDDVSVWQRIAISTWYEPSPAITAFIRSSLATLAQLKDPVYKQMSQNAASTLYLSKNIPLGLQYAYNVIWTTESGQLENIILEQLSWSNNLNAQNLYYRLTQRMAGVSQVLTQVDFWTTSIDGFFSTLSELVSPDVEISKNRPPWQEIIRSTSWIRKTLNIQPRNISNLEGVLRINMNDINERMFPFSSNIKEYLTKAGKNLIDEMNVGKDIIYTSLDEKSFSMSTATEMGFPLTFQISRPQILSTYVRTNLSESSLVIETKLIYSSEMLSDIQFYSEWDKNVYTAGIYEFSFGQIPSLRMKAVADVLHRKLKIDIFQREDRNVTHLVHHKVMPFTSYRDVTDLSPLSIANTTKICHVRKPHQETYIFGNMNVTYTSETKSLSFSEWLRNSVSIEVFTLMQNSIEQKTVDITWINLPSVTIELDISSAYVKNGDLVMQQNEPTQTDHRVYNNTFSDTVKYSTSEENVHAERSGINQEKHLLSQSAVDDQNNKISTINFSALSFDPFISQLNESEYLLQQFLSNMHSGKAYVIDMTLSVNSTEITSYSTFFAYASNPTKIVQKLGFFVKEGTLWQSGITAVKINSEMAMLNLQQMMERNISESFNIIFSYKRPDSEYKLNMLGEISRTEERTKFLHSLQNMQECLDSKSIHDARISPKCRHLMYEAQFWDRCNITILYNDEIASSGMLLRSILRTSEKWLLPYLVDKFDNLNTNTSNRLKAVVDLNKESQSLKLWVRSPNTEMKFSGLPINPTILSCFRFNPDLNCIVQSSNEPYCGISVNKIITFDGEQFDYTMDGCWHVITKDCSGKYRMSVLARNVYNEMELEINLDNYKLISLRPGPAISINDKEVILEEGQVVQVEDKAGTLLIQMSFSSDRAIRVQLPAHEMSIVYSSLTSIVTSGTGYWSGLAGRLCGLCGNYDGERVGEFLNPTNYVEQSAHAFASSYRLNDSTCH